MSSAGRISMSGTIVHLAPRCSSSPQPWPQAVSPRRFPERGWSATNGSQYAVYASASASASLLADRYSPHPWTRFLLPPRTHPVHLWSRPSSEGVVGLPTPHRAPRSPAERAGSHARRVSPAPWDRRSGRGATRTRRRPRGTGSQAPPARRGRHRIGLEPLGDGALQAELPESRRREHAASYSPLAPSRSACRRSPGSSGRRARAAALQLRSDGGCWSDHGAGESPRTADRETRQSRTSPAAITAPMTTRRRPRRQVLQRVHGIDLAVAERTLELGGEEPLAADLGEGSPLACVRSPEVKITLVVALEARLRRAGARRRARSALARARKRAYRGHRRRGRRSAHRSLGARCRTDRDGVATSSAFPAARVRAPERSDRAGASSRASAKVLDALGYDRDRRPRS